MTAIRDNMVGNEQLEQSKWESGATNWGVGERLDHEMELNWHCRGIGW